MADHTPEEMTTWNIRAEIETGIAAYGKLRHPLSKRAMIARIKALYEELERRDCAQVNEGSLTLPRRRA